MQENFRNRILARNEAYIAETLNQTNGKKLSNIQEKINTHPSLHTQWSSSKDCLMIYVGVKSSFKYKKISNEISQ